MSSNISRIQSDGIFEDKIGYCRAVVCDKVVYVSGCVAPGDIIPKSIEGQCAQIINLIGETLKRAGSSFMDVLRVQYIVPNADEFHKCWPLLKETFGAHPPAALMISAPLIDPKYLIEIEVTARLSLP